MAQKEKEAEGRRDRLSLHLSISPSLRLSFSISTILFQICLKIGVLHFSHWEKCKMEKKEKERNIEKKGGLALFTAPNSMINEHRFQGKFETK